MGADESVHAQSRDREHGRRGEVDPDLQLVLEMPQGKEQVQTGARLAPDRLNDQDHDVRILITLSWISRTVFF